MNVGVVAQNVVRKDGQGRVTVELVRALLRHGHAVSVYSHRIDDEIRSAVEWITIPELRGPQLLDDLLFLACATRAVRRHDHDAVLAVGPTALPQRPWLYHAQFSHAGWRATWTRADRPNAPHRIHAAVAAALERWCAGRATAVVATTGQLGRESTGTRRPAPVVEATLGVDHDEFVPATDSQHAAARTALGVPADRICVAFLGGYATGRKGLDHLLQALTLDGGPGPFHVVVAGSGPRQEVEARTASLGIADHVTVAGFTDPHTVLHAADIVAVPSTYEPFSLVAVEAAAAGLPVVITRCAGAASTLGSGAVVVEHAGDVRALRDALARLEDHHERTTLGRAARAAVATLTWEHAMDRIVATLEATSAGAHPRDDRIVR